MQNFQITYFWNIKPEYMRYDGLTPYPPFPLFWTKDLFIPLLVYKSLARCSFGVLAIPVSSPEKS
ncbi:MAG: hypothetical protein C0407_01985 [Desulfobacca sp.]|nr:hypothetical protein [Desulfobacca sp.]